MRFQKVLAVVPALSGMALLTAACGDGTAATGTAPWDADQVTVVKPGDDPELATLPGENACLEVPGGECVELVERCEAGGASDVILDEDGNLVDVVCLPADAVTITPVQLADGEIPQNANNTAVEFSGAVYEDDLIVDANNVVLYGADPDDAVIQGSLEVTGNNTIVRGVTIDGDVTIEKNNATFVFCRITGDVTIVGNNTLLSGCEIFGDVTIRGNNTILNGNLFGGRLDVPGQNLECSGEANRSFVDENDNGIIEKDEIGDEIGC